MDAKIVMGDLLEPFNLLGLLWMTSYAVFAFEVLSFYAKKSFTGKRIKTHHVSTWYLNHYFIYIIFVIVGIMLASPDKAQNDLSTGVHSLTYLNNLLKELISVRPFVTLFLVNENRFLSKLNFKQNFLGRN